MASEAREREDANRISRRVLIKLRNYLTNGGACSKADEEALLKECAQRVAAAVEEA